MMPDLHKIGRIDFTNTIAGTYKEDLIALYNTDVMSSNEAALIVLNGDPKRCKHMIVCTPEQFQSVFFGN